MAHQDPSYMCSLFSCLVVKSVLNKLIKDISNEIKSNATPFRKDDLKKLVKSVSSISTAVPDLEQLASNSEVEDLIFDLTEVAYDIEDLLDEAATQRLEKKVSRSGRIIPWQRLMKKDVSGIKDLFPRKNKGPAQDVEQPGPDFGPDLKILLAKLDKIAGSAAELSTSLEASSYSQQLVSSEVPILGQEDDKERLIHCILNPSTCLEHLIVINVTGPGGIGKTTLVEAVCNDPRVSSSFDFVSWTSHDGRLSYEDGLKRLIQDINGSVRGRHNAGKGISLGTLGDELLGILQGRKFLLVVDDIKHELLSGWKQYLGLLKRASEGTTVILISWKPIEMIQDSITFHFEGVPERECWSLFKRIAEFDEDADPSLRDIGRSIVKKCGGSPLAVKSLASLLRNNKDRQYWEQIHQSKLWGLDNKACVALCISFQLQRAPVELIPSYIVFSKNISDIESKNKLVWFWMAQGLLQSTEECHGLRFCKELDQLQLIHQTGHHLCLLERNFKDYLSEEQIDNVSGHFLRSKRVNLMWTEDMLYALPMVSSTPTCKPRTVQFNPHLREKRFFPEERLFPEELISHLKCLRSLILDYFGLLVLPESIGNLKLLRYLSLCNNFMLQRLPDSICKLVNLQTLDVSVCGRLNTLPRNMHRLVSMRHLLLSQAFINSSELAFKSWTSLHYLKISYCPLASMVEYIQYLTVLRTLKIKFCNDVAYFPNNISRLTGLKELSILYCRHLDLTGWKGLHGLRSLKSLQIQRLPKLLELPDGLQSAADSLEHLEIGWCENLRTLPDSLERCTRLVDITLQHCPNLSALPQGIHALKNMQFLQILGCPNLVKKCERITGNDWHLISHIPIIYLDNEVIRNIDTSSVQEQPGALNFSPSNEIRPASATSSGEIIPVPEGHSFYPSDYEGATKHSHPVTVEQSHPLHPSGLNINVQTASIPLTHHPATDARKLENQGASSNEQLFRMQVLDIEKEMEGKGILFLFGDHHEFEKEMLIQLWMALGILRDEPMEVIGTYYFEKLVSEGYILSTVADSFYKVNTKKLKTGFNMIPAERNYVILDNGSQNEAASSETLHVSVVCDEIDDESIFTTLGRFNRLRTLLFLRNYGSRLQEVPRDIFLSYECLVALDLSGAHIKELPSSAEKMINLQFLDLSWTFIELLPDRIDHFEMLQTLKLKGCSHLHRLPINVKGLTNLRHLDLDVLGQLASFPKGIGALVNLRTLSAFPVGREEGLKISELKYLDNLSGEFCIAKLENVQSGEEAKRASLTAKRSIKKLELRWSDPQFQEPENEDEAVLENLFPCSDLEEINILCYHGTSFPSWITDVSFHKLVHISLFKCVRVSVLPFLEKLPELVFLELISLNSVANVNFKGEVDNAAFPKLQKLVIDEMLNVESWGEAQEGDYPCLINVSIKDCPKLPELPSLVYLPCIKNLEVIGCTKLAFVSEKELSPSLQQLIVEDCPLIKERCSEQGGQDWYKIQHVLTIWIDQVAIKTNEMEEDDDDDDDESYDWDVFD